MANVNINFNGKDFLLSCEDGQEEHLDELSNILNNKFNKLKTSLGNIGENKLLLITSITVLDEYYETKKRINKKKIEIDEIKNKFKELKSLVYEFKKNKDIQIHLLNEKQKDQLQSRVKQKLDLALQTKVAVLRRMGVLLVRKR